MDEFGGTAGFVTLEDLLEAIVGEISDPFDVVTPEVQQMPDGTILIDGLTQIEDVNMHLGLELDEEQSVIRREIAGLPKKYRTVIILKYMQDLSYEEIADILRCSIGTVKSRLSRAKEKLKQRLERAVEVRS